MTDAMREAAVTAFFRASGLLDEARLQLWDKAGLTVTQLRLLYYLNECEGVGNAELADRLMVTRPSVSALLERLERGGFIRREISPDDRRGICIWLEPRGRQAVAQMTVEMRAYGISLMESMTEQEIRDLTISLERLVESGRQVRARELEAQGVSSPV